MADTIAIENAVRGLYEFGQRIEQHRDAVREMELKPIAERIAKLESEEERDDTTKLEM